MGSMWSTKQSRKQVVHKAVMVSSGNQSTKGPYYWQLYDILKGRQRHVSPYENHLRAGRIVDLVEL